MGMTHGICAQAEMSEVSCIHVAPLVADVMLESVFALGASIV